MRYIELFAGIGAPRCALERVSEALGEPMECIGISEIDKWAIKSYNAIFGDTPNLGNIKDIETLPEADLWVYGFPCQDITKMGLMRGLGEGTRSGCLFDVMRLLTDSPRPEWLVMENVSDLVNKRFKADFDAYVGFLESLGYRSKWRIMNASDYGIPQHRKRVFMVSRLDAEPPDLPEPTGNTSCIGDILEENVDRKYYLSQKLLDGFRRASDRNGAHGSHICFTVKERERVAFAITTKAGTRMTDNFIRDPVQYGKLDRYTYDTANRVYDVSAVSPTIIRADGGGHIPCIKEDEVGSHSINSEGIRRLTPRECWRLMDRSDEEFDRAQRVCSDTQLYKQAGNSIVVRPLELIFTEIVKAMR